MKIRDNLGDLAINERIIIIIIIHTQRNRVCGCEEKASEPEKGPVNNSCEHDNELSDSINRGKFLHKACDY
jgi:hypothetical protein